MALEVNFDGWRNYKNSGSLSDSQRRMHLAEWLSISWSLIRTQHDFIRKCFDATVLVQKSGENRLRMDRLAWPYVPFSPAELAELAELDELDELM